MAIFHLRLASQPEHGGVPRHHTLFFNVLFNEIREESRNKKASQYFLSRDRPPGGYVIRETGETPCFHHVVAVAELYEAGRSGRLFTHHFNMLRSILEKTASFHGYRNFATGIKQDTNDEEGLLHQGYFKKILHDFINHHPFNLALFPSAPAPAPATASVPTTRAT